MNKIKKLLKKLFKFSFVIFTLIAIFSIITLSNFFIKDADISNITITEGTLPITEKIITTNNNHDLSLHEYNELDKQNQIISTLKATVDKYSVSDKVAISFTDLTTGTYLGFNDTKEFTAASTIKLPLAIYICNKLEKGEIKLTDTLAYSPSDYEGGAGDMLDTKPGQRYTVQTLLENTLIYSDNIAANMFFRYYGFSKMKTVVGELVGVDFATSGNVATTEQMNKCLEFLYSNKDKPYYKDVVSLLSKTVFHDRLDKYLPQEIVSHKIGNYEGNTHDVGIIFLDKPYALSVYTDNVEGAEELIASLSKELYDFLSSLKN